MRLMGEMANIGGDDYSAGVYHGHTIMKLLLI